jgi:adenylyltransferase/sulfurtransferase
MSVHEIQAEELKHRLDAGEDLFLLDVREEDEFATTNIGGHLIPLSQLPERVKELDSSHEIVTICKRGPRGVKAADFLSHAGFKVSNLSGGLYAWSDRVDPSVPKY